MTYYDNHKEPQYNMFSRPTVSDGAVYDHRTDATSDAELKPCPFCGCSKLHRSMIDEPNLDIIVCDSCDIWFVGSDEEWNRRVKE